MTKTSSILKSFIVIPMIATSLSLSSFTAGVDQFVAAKADDQALSIEAKALQLEREEKATKIDAYYGRHDLPLTGYGMKMVLAGEKYGVDPFLIAGLAMRESTAGKRIPKGSYNAFGWGNAKFESFDHAIDTVAKNLGGHNEKTAHYYKNKSVEKVLKTYNSVIPTYTSEILSIMKRIDQMPV
ncbi:MAG: hypothetical protein AAB681_01595 [Patescibacteria group bacterium]